MMGIRKLRVLPVPVCAVARTSLPSRAGGIAPACTGVGVTKFAEARRDLSAGEMLKSENWFICSFLVGSPCCLRLVGIRCQRYQERADLGRLRKNFVLAGPS